MRTAIRNLFLLSLLAGLASCASDDLLNDPSDAVVGNTDSEIRHITVTLPTIEVEEGVASTRNQFINMGTEDWTAVWAEGDTLGIFPSSGGQVEFAVTEFGSNTSVFDGGGWALKSAVTYAAYYPFDKHNVYVTNKTIPLDYTGQVQQGNGSYDHLGSYDFLASKAMPRSGNSLNFELLRQGYVICLTLTVPATDTYTEIDLVTDGTPFVTKAELDITSTTAPAVTAKEKSNTIRLSLQDVSLSKNETLTAYMMAFPVGNVTPRVVLHGKNGTYEGVVNNVMNLTRNKMGIRSATLTGATLKNLYLIAAAEANDGVDFTNYKDANTGYVPLNNADVIAMLAKVKSIDVNGKNDPTVCDEIGYFPNLTELSCSNNRLTTLDVSKNLLLTTLDCRKNNLTSLNVSNNKALTILVCNNNTNLASLDVSNNKALWILDCENGKLKTLNVSNNLKLASLNCSHNALTALDVSNNASLLILNSSYNSLSSLDITNNELLAEFYCSNNALGSLDVSKNGNLYKLDCSHNSLKKLDFSNNAILEELNCDFNSLSSLNVTKNPKLTKLRCLSNQLKTLNVANNTELTDLNCSMNSLTALDITNNKKIKVLSCSDNLIKTLTITGSDLEYLYCRNNELVEFSLNVVGKLIRSIDFSGCKKLKKLSIADEAEYYSTGYTTQFSSLNVDGCTALEELTCHGTAITKLDITTCTALKELHCYFNRLNNGLDVSKNTQLTLLECFHNNMSSLDITACPNLNLNNVFCGNRSTQCTLWVTESQNDSGFLINTPCYLQNVEYGNVNDNVTVKVKN